jgi:hypothetical protein
MVMVNVLCVRYYVCMKGHFTSEVSLTSFFSIDVRNYDSLKVGLQNIRFQVVLNVPCEIDRRQALLVCSKYSRLFL